MSLRRLRLEKGWNERRRETNHLKKRFETQKEKGEVSVREKELRRAERAHHDSDRRIRRQLKELDSSVVGQTRLDLSTRKDVLEQRAGVLLRHVVLDRRDVALSWSSSLSRLLLVVGGVGRGGDVDNGIGVLRLGGGSRGDGSVEVSSVGGREDGAVCFVAVGQKRGGFNERWWVDLGKRGRKDELGSRIREVLAEVERLVRNL